MDFKKIKNLPMDERLAVAVFFVLICFSVYQFLQISTLSIKLGSLSKEVASTTAMLAQNTGELTQSIAELRSQTVGISNTLSNTQQNIDDVKTKVGGFEQAVGTISGTVGNLQKLSQIDPELLKKYSKVYFMNENYIPAHLTDLPKDYLYSATNSESFMTEAWSHLKDLLDATKARGVPLFIKSAYRSFAQQQTLKSAYTVVYGAGSANSFSADQGYSEHQLGTTVDFITTGLDGQLDERFDKTEAFKWLTANAFRYGFVLSYPSGNDYYVYEPWHWRFVGTKLANSLRDNKLDFYNVDQRQIDAYLINFFD